MNTINEQRRFVTGMIRNVRMLAHDHPDFVYRPLGLASACKNLPDELNPCGCIVGAAYHCTTGEPLASYLDQAGVMKVVVSTTGRSVLQRFERELAWLDCVQSQQDKQASWYDAMLVADREMELY